MGFPISPNVDLFSETGWSAEIGVKQGFKISEFNGLIDLALFRTDYQDMMEFTFTRNLAIGFQSQNIGNTIINGIDFNISGTGKIGGLPLTVLAGYTYIDPKFKEFNEEDMAGSSFDGNLLKYRFEHTGKLDVITDYNKFNLGFTIFYYSHMKAIDALFEFIIPGVADFRAENNKGALILESRASYAFNDSFKASILAKNLTNSFYTLRPALVEAPFNISLRLDYAFSPKKKLNAN